MNKLEFQFKNSLYRLLSTVRIFSIATASVLLVRSTFSFAANDFENEFNSKFDEIQMSYQRFQFSENALLNSLKYQFKGKYVFEVKGPIEEHPYYHKTMNIIDQKREEYYEGTIVPLANKYSWGIPNDLAIQTIKKYGPIVEIGAGRGYWASLMRREGVDIVAYDDFSWDSKTRYSDIRWFDVKPGSETAVLRHQDRTLFLCWPPMGSEKLASNVLSIYMGKFLIYVGEAQGGRTGDHEFFEIIKREFETVETVEIPNWPGYHDQLIVYQRKPMPSSAETEPSANDETSTILSVWKTLFYLM